MNSENINTLEEWEREKQKLQKLVEQQAADLNSKNRELEIESALERVRARTMAMKKSEELAEVAFVLFEQLRELGGNLWGTGFGLCRKDKEEDVFWFANENGVFPPNSIPNTSDPAHKKMYEGWKTGEEFLAIEGSGKDLKNHYEYMMSLPEVRPFFQKMLDEGLSFPEWQQWNAAYFKHGYLLIITLEPYPDPDILKRFAKVFDQTYTRFLDLQKAEAQARESEIQLALERVRAKSMAMHNSEELADLSMELVKQVQALGIETWGSAFHIYAEDAEGDYEWFSSREGTLPFYKTPRENFFLKFYEKGKAGETFHVEEFIGEDCKDHYDYLMTLPVIGDALREIMASGGSLPESQYDHIAFFKYGFVLFITYEPVPEAHDIFKRFAKVFEQTYTRFLDLKKAEEQAREAKIETALEKVRSRTMGMQSSDELPEVANLLFLEVQDLGIPAWSCGYNILNDDKKTAAAWMSSEGTLQEPFTLRLFGEKSFDEQGEFVRSDETMLVQELGGKDLEEHYEHMKSFPDVRPQFEKLEEQGFSLPTYQINHLCKFSHGFLLFITYEPVREAHDIFRRFATVFDQTYTRFLDLQKSEQRAREAEVELSLERVRAQVMAMQKSSDLFDIVVNMRKEFVSLGHRADYFWYMNWLPESYEMSMTSEDGNRIGVVIKIPKFVHDAIPGLSEWEKGTDPVYVLALNAADAWDYIEHMNTHGKYEQADPHAPTEDDIREIGGLTFIIARTSHGEIGFSLPGEVTDPPQDALDTLVRFAGVFDLAYQRFEDLQEAEHQAKLIREERDRLETTLKELHATQDQLIQQEKLASLGQLTAGIAHEIKNPLNFVNNFSELSVELVEEAREELRRGTEDRGPRVEKKKSPFEGESEQGEQGDEAELGHASNLDLIHEILDDIEMNLKKIHEHGSRADSIVKSMLEHSLGGSGEMALTDLNSLVKEFVNLAFHGMRAGKDPINVDMEFALDDLVGDVPLIAEDFSRLIINLTNNAFDAMREKLNAESGIQNSEEYKPKLTIRTRSGNSGITLEFEDNGPGIPEEIKDKILQPFFTTKRGTDGTGLGLSITNDIIKAHGGCLEVATRPNEGTSFIIKLSEGE